MKISRTFEVARSRERVWELFQDVPRVATCIPGTRITEAGADGEFKGRVELKLGPIAAAFEGAATHETNADEWTGTIAGTGRDRSVGSRAKFVTQYALTPIGDGTRVSVESDVTLAGAVAQFGRTGLVEEVTARILDQFAANLETELSGSPAAGEPAAQLKADMGAILWAGFKARLCSWISRLFRRRREE